MTDCCGGNCLMRCPPAAPAATPLTFDGWWNTDPKDEAGNEYDLEHFYLLREGWRACITHRARPLERENADLRGNLEQARRTAEYWKAEHLAGNKAIETAERQRNEALKDAERYRWLRQDDMAIALMAEKGKRRSPASYLDAAIDAALKEASNG